MEHNRSDEIIRARLENAAVPPPPFVWEGIERTLHHNRRKPFPWLWLTGFLLTGALVGGAWLWYTNSKTTLSQPVTPATPMLVAPKTALPTAENALNTDNLPLQTAPDNSTISNTPNTNSTATNQKINTKTPPKSNFSAKSNTSYAKAPAQNAPQASNTINSEFKGQDELLTPDIFKYYIENRSKANNNNGCGFVSEYIKALPSGTMAQSLTALHHPLPQRLAPHKITRLNSSRYNLDERRSAWFIDAYTGPLMAQKVLTNNTPSPEADIYRQLRLDTEGTGWGGNTGVRATRLLGGHWLIGTGLDYRQFTEKFTFDQEAQLQYTVENNGTDTIAATFGRRSMLRYNRFGFINLPISAGYEWRQRRVGIQVRVGASANLYFWKNGSILDPDTFHPTAFGPGNQGVFKTSAGFQAHASTQLFWQFRRDMRIFVEPFCETSLNPLTLSDFPTSQRYQIYGLKWGITKIF